MRMRVAVVHALRRFGRREQHAHARGSSACACSGGPWFVVPHGVTVPHGLDVDSVSSVSSCTTSTSSSIVGSSSGSTSTDCAIMRGLELGALRLTFGERALRGLGPFTVHVENAWCVMSSAPVSRRDAARAAEVIGMRVRDDHGVHVA